MTDLATWLATRRPTPPRPLADWLGENCHAKGNPVTAWTEAASAALGRVRSQPGRVRKSAYELLGADALVTYACEAALDADQPDRVLREILRRVADGAS